LAILLTAGAAELSLTFAGDTLTLPLTAYVQAHNLKEVEAEHVGYGIVTPAAGEDTHGAAINLAGGNRAEYDVIAADAAAWSRMAKNCLGALPAQGEEVRGDETAEFSTVPAARLALPRPAN